MKSVLITLVVILCLAIISIYIFIPRRLVLSEVVVANANPEATGRVLIHRNDWQKILTANNPGTGSIINNASVFVYKNDTFTIVGKHQSSLDISIASSAYNINSSLRILPANRDTVALSWEARIANDGNPFEKVKKYNWAVGIKKDMSEILRQLSTYVQKQENLYGVSIEKTTTKDTFLVATKAVLPSYPSTSKIYQMVAILNAQLERKGAAQTSPPMVNVTKMDSAKYLIMVALSTNTKIADEGNVFFRRMVPGSFLLSKVRGGVCSVSNAMDNMRLFISDYGKTSMAIPFQSLVTDRSKEPDTSKWITKIYYPVNY